MRRTSKKHGRISKSNPQKQAAKPARALSAVKTSRPRVDTKNAPTVNAPKPADRASKNAGKSAPVKTPVVMKKAVAPKHKKRAGTTPRPLTSTAAREPVTIAAPLIVTATDAPAIQSDHCLSELQPDVVEPVAVLEAPPAPVDVTISHASRITGYTSLQGTLGSGDSIAVTPAPVISSATVGESPTIPGTGYASLRHRVPQIVEDTDGEEDLDPDPIITSPAEEKIDHSFTPPEPTARDDDVDRRPLLFEVGWEVCWQLGGIYTVLKTKAQAMLKKWAKRYCLIGPYNPATALTEFDDAPAEGIIAQALAKLAEVGIPARFGRWLVPGRPNTILIDYRSRFWTLDRDKYLLWADHGITTPADDGELNEVVAFGFAVAEFFSILASLRGERPILAHFHEWMAGVAVPRIAHQKTAVQTIFTTHATLLGRYLASDSPDFYSHLPFINPDEMAQKYNIYPRFAIERAAAHAATVFTTVSEVTAVEAERLLGRRPDVILPNGLNIHRFAALHEFQNLHRQSKERIHEFVMGHFFPAYDFDLDNTIYFVTSGRYEYRNKGMDLFVEALHRLNERMRGMEKVPTVVAFIITRAPTRSMSVSVLQSNSVFHDLKMSCEDLAKVMGERLYKKAAKGDMPSLQDLLDEDTVVRLKKSIHTWRNGRQPPIVTHDMVNDADDPILRHLRHRRLFNAKSDKVKVVFHPDFVSSTNPLFGMDYEQFVRGCHLGIFPSYYEPWGYTPMECVALGVPAITTDLSGFGAFVEATIANHEENGIFVVNRRTNDFERSVDHLTDFLYQFILKNRRQRIELRNRVERMSEKFDWAVLGLCYADAHNLALERGNYALEPGKFEIRQV